MATQIGPTEGSGQDERARIQRNAARHAEATVYSMNNQYLTRAQRALVEAWFQFPIGVFSYLLIIHLASDSHQYAKAFISAYVIAGVVSLLNRFVSLPTPVLVALGLLFAGWVETGVSAAFIVFFLYHGAWGAAAIALASATGLISVLAPSVHLYTVLSPRGLNPKYAFAKSRFGITFPFEDRD